MKKYIEIMLRYFTVENLLKQRKLLVYLVFVVIASIFWLLIALSENYNTQILYPVRFTNMPDDKVLVNELPKYLNLNVDGYGFTLLRYKVKRSMAPINVDVKKNNLFGVFGKDNKYFILTRYLTKLVSSHISDDLKIIDIQPDSIIFDFSRMIKKKVVVRPRVEYTLDKQYLLKHKAWCEPDSIEISGPNSIIDTIDYVETSSLDLDKLSKSIQRNIWLKSIDGVKLSDKRVKVNIGVEKFTEGTISLPIHVQNLPDSLVLKTFPDKIELSYKVALSDFSKVKPYQFKLVVDYNDFIPGSSYNFHKMRVGLKQFPSFVHSVRYSPKHVDYLFEKK